MSRRKRRGDETAPALFPFLAVLLCTIGALVLMLVLTITNSHASAKRDAETALTEVQDSSDIIHVVSEELIAQREAIKKQVERRRKDLADIEDHIARLTNSLEQLASKLERIQNESTQTETTRTETSDEVAALRKEIDEKKQELIDEIENQKKRKPAFAVIPYVGPNGTSRRPVYLECTKDGVVIQPEGLLISLNDLKPPLGPGNPLDAALRVLRLAYQQRDKNFGITQPPYPLLMIRPDGIHTYALAREAMRGWDDQFGYELIDSEMNLAFPAGLPGLKEELAKTIDVAKLRQQALIASMPRRLRAAENEETWDAIDQQTVESGNSARAGDPTASSSQGNNPNEKFSGTPSDGNSLGGSRGFAVGSGAEQGWQMVQGMANAQVTGAIQKNGLESAQTSGGSNNPMRTSGLQPGTNPGAFSSGSEISGQFQATNGGEPAQPGYGTQPNSQTSGTQSSITRNTSTGTSAANSSGTSSANSSGTDSSGDTDNNAGTGTANGQGGLSAGATGPGSSSNADGQSPANAASGGSAAPPGANAFSSGSASGSGTSGLQSAGAPTEQTQPGGQAAPNLSVAMKAGDEAPKAKHVRPEGDLKPISVTAGRGWAASRAEGKATPVSRPINVIALKDRWLLRSDIDPSAFEANVTMEDGPQQAGNQLATAIRKRVDSWGLSVPGGFWSPTLTIEAASDAQQSVARLERLLEGSGVEIKVVPLSLPKRR